MQGERLDKAEYRLIADLCAANMEYLRACEYKPGELGKSLLIANIEFMRIVVRTIATMEKQRE